MNVHYASVGDDAEKEKETWGCQVHLSSLEKAVNDAYNRRETTGAGGCLSIAETCWTSLREKMRIEILLEHLFLFLDSFLPILGERKCFSLQRNSRNADTFFFLDVKASDPIRNE